MPFILSRILLIGFADIASLYNGDFIYSLVISLGFLGIYLNHNVCILNGGTMPVFPNFSDKEINDQCKKNIIDSKYHHLGSEDTKFKFLTDIINIRAGVFTGVHSFGDMLVHLSFIFSCIYIFDLVTATL